MKKEKYFFYFSYRKERARERQRSSNREGWRYGHTPLMAHQMFDFSTLLLLFPSHAVNSCEASHDISLLFVFRCSLRALYILNVSRELLFQVHFPEFSFASSGKRSKEMSNKA